MPDTDNPLIGATPSTEVPRYAGKATFARITDIHEVSDYEIAVLGVPFDGGTPYRPGARFGAMVFDLLSLIVANSSTSAVQPDQTGDPSPRR